MSKRDKVFKGGLYRIEARQGPIYVTCLSAREVYLIGGCVDQENALVCRESG